MYCMYNGAFKSFFTAKTAHRFSKLVTLGVSTSLLVVMVNLDASASSNFVGRDASSLSTAMLMKLANQSGNREYSGVMRRHWPLKPTSATTTTLLSRGSGGGNPPTTTTTSPPTTTTTSPPTTTTTSTTTTTTPTTPSNPATAGGPITAGPSRSECLEPDNPTGDYSVASLQSLVSNFDNLTNSNVTCLISYMNGAPAWSNWVSPWITEPQVGFGAWIAQDPQVRQLVLQVDLIPLSLQDTNDPLGWEQSCANGDFNSYATQLGKNLVADGLQSTVIRLGAEMNGAWETDYMGGTTQEQSLWATCFDNEVTGLRQAAGEHFLIDWNPNACTQSVPYSNFYPGNAYVDIMGLDFYDLDCDTPSTAVTFTQLTNEPYGLASFESFASAQGKAMSFPEWGLSTTPNGDDPAYIDGIGSAVANGDFAFEAYFDAGSQGMMMLGSTTPLSIAAFHKWFGNS
jgi:hypothetical protein